MSIRQPSGDNKHISKVLVIDQANVSYEHPTLSAYACVYTLIYIYIWMDIHAHMQFTYAQICLCEYINNASKCWMKEKILHDFCLAMIEEPEQHYKNGNLRHHKEMQTISFLNQKICFPRWLKEIPLNSFLCLLMSSLHRISHPKSLEVISQKQIYSEFCWLHDIISSSGLNTMKRENRLEWHLLCYSWKFSRGGKKVEVVKKRDVNEER